MAEATVEQLLRRVEELEGEKKESALRREVEQLRREALRT